jgi:IS30 family transposase
MKNYKQLTREQRYQIYALKKAEHSMGYIANNIGVDKSTVSRELKRNTGQRGYRPKQAHKKAVQRHKEKPKTIRLNEEAKAFIKLQLESFDSAPEQISGRMDLTLGFRVSHETIYRYLLADKEEDGTLYLHLRHQNKPYKKRYGSTDRRGQIPNRTSIDERPAIVDEKSRIGDFEGDLVIGKNHKGALVTMVDRCSKYTLIASTPNKRADNVDAAIIKLLGPFQDSLESITLDNGKEFSHHEKIAKALDTSIYFAHPYHSWERGLNEHTNGLLRQYFPKSSSLENVTKEEIADAQYKLNHRPRKALGFKTPYEVFFDKLNVSGQAA